MHLCEIEGGEGLFIDVIYDFVIMNFLKFRSNGLSIEEEKSLIFINIFICVSKIKV